MATILGDEYFRHLYQAEGLHWWSRGMRDYLRTLVGKHLKGCTELSVLDAGCGTGMNLAWLKQHFKVRMAVGVDVADAALTYARQRLGNYVLKASATELPFRSEIFDLTISTDVLQHLPGDDWIEAALAEFRRVTRKRGILILRTRSVNGPNPPEETNNLSDKWFQCRPLSDYLESQGWEIRFASYVNMFPSLVAAFRSAVARKVRTRLTPPAEVSRPPIQLPGKTINWIMHRLILLERAINTGLGIRYPYGHSLICVARRGS